MAKPPPADPEKYIIGRGLYSNLRIARPFADQHVFRIEPMPPPFRSCLVSGLIFAVTCAGFYAARRYLSPADDINPWVILLGLAVLGSLAWCLAAAVACGSLLAVRSAGPCLIYDKTTGRVELPWEGEAFTRDEVIHVQYITTKRLDGGHPSVNEQLSELNLITQRGGLRQRWPMLRSIDCIKAFDYLVKPLIEHTGLPVILVEDKWLDWQVTERPYT